MIEPAAHDEQLYNSPWVLSLNTDGIVMLHAVLPNGALIPAAMFQTPEALRTFKEDVVRAYENFIPLPVREAMDIVEKVEKEGFIVDRKRTDPPPDQIGKPAPTN